MGYSKGLVQDINERDCSSTGKEMRCNGAINCPLSPCAENGVDCGTATNNVRIKWEGMSNYRVKSECLSLPLKYGGSLSLAWHFQPYLGYSWKSVKGAKYWLPAGKGGNFSFFPYITNLPESEAPYPRMNADGLIKYVNPTTLGSITYYESESPSVFSAWHDDSTLYFHEYDKEMQSYYVYGGKTSTLAGRPLQYTDRNGNTLYYHYGDLSSSCPLLRKITGDIQGITPYFEYDSEISSTSYLAFARHLTQIHLQNNANPEDSRTIYFEYTDLSVMGFLEKIKYPDGCTINYGLSEACLNHQKIDREIDSLGYETYYIYDADTRNIIKSVEPEERITYFDYQTSPYYLTTITQKGRQPKYYRYALSSQGSTLTSYEKNPLGHTTYYEWTTSDRIRKQKDPNGKITYFEYNSDNALQKKIEDGNVTEYNLRRVPFFSQF